MIMRLWIALLCEWVTISQQEFFHFHLFKYFDNLKYFKYFYKEWVCLTIWNFTPQLKNKLPHFTKFINVSALYCACVRFQLAWWNSCLLLIPNANVMFFVYTRWKLNICNEEKKSWKFWEIMREITRKMVWTGNFRCCCNDWINMKMLICIIMFIVIFSALYVFVFKLLELYI